MKQQYFVFQWHITDKCDQRCKHCYIFAEDNNIPLIEMSYNQMVYVVESCISMCKAMNRKPYFAITGGDPILNPDFWNILKVLKYYKIRFCILGNPFHIDDNVCMRLKSYGCEKYQMSIDGLRNTHDEIRREGSFDETIEKIKCIRKSGMTCAIMTTVSGTNFKELPQIIDIMVKNKVDVFAFARYCPTSLEKSTHIEPDEYKELLEVCWKKFIQYRNSNTEFIFKDHLWTLFFYEKGMLRIDKNLQDNVIYSGCHCAISHLSILPNGDIYACRRLDSKVGNIFEDNLYGIFTGENLSWYRQYNNFKKCSKCELLRFCRGCPSVSYGYTHNFYESDPQCWKEV